MPKEPLRPYEMTATVGSPTVAIPVLKPVPIPVPTDGRDEAHLVCEICFPIGTSPVRGSCGVQASGEPAPDDFPRCAACRWLDTLPILPCGH